jgi:DNA-binding MarR family transcriptional regulator
MHSDTSYLRFLQITSAINALPCSVDLDLHEKAMFDLLCLHWSKNQPLTVSDAINQPQLGSSSTLHKRLTRLISKDLIVVKHKGDNKRTKYVLPSENGNTYIQWLSEQLTTLCESIASTSLSQKLESN